MSGRLSEALLKSAWPTPAVDNLLRAAVLADRDAAAASWADFEAVADFDNLTWGEFRLISLAAKRLADLAPDSSMRPRISGIERSVWSRGQLVIGEAATGLRKLGDAGVELLIIKGAGRAASGEAAARGRIVNDIDIVVHPADMERAFDILVADGWTPAGSGSPLYHRARLADVTGINLVRGEFGNLDLHRTPFHAPFDQADEDGDIWQRSQEGKLGCASVRVPGPLDTVVIAIAHGSLDAHKSSDWLADIAVSIDKGIDWDLLLRIVKRRRLETAAAIALDYVRERLGRPVPNHVIQALQAAAARNPIKLVATVAEARPKSDRFGLFWLARAFAKQGRLLRVRRKAARRSPVVLASPFPQPAASAPGETFALEQEIDLPDRKPGEAWAGTVEIDLLTDLPAAARRVEFEINTADRHLMRLRAVVRNRGARQLPLRFKARLDVPHDAAGIVLRAVPGRSFNDKALPEELGKYAATPFALLRVKADSKR